MTTTLAACTATALLLSDGSTIALPPALEAWPDTSLAGDPVIKVGCVRGTFRHGVLLPVGSPMELVCSGLAAAWRWARRRLPAMPDWEPVAV